jgi:hypothetical protein
MVCRKQARKARQVWFNLHDTLLYVKCTFRNSQRLCLPARIYASCNSVITKAALSCVVLRRVTGYSHHSTARNLFQQIAEAHELHVFEDDSGLLVCFVNKIKVPKVLCRRPRYADVGGPVIEGTRDGRAHKAAHNEEGKIKEREEPGEVSREVKVLSDKWTHAAHGRQESSAALHTRDDPPTGSDDPIRS